MTHIEAMKQALKKAIRAHDEIIDELKNAALDSLTGVINDLEQAIATEEDGYQGSDAAKAAHMMDLYTALGVKWGEDPFAVIAKMREAATEESSAVQERFELIGHADLAINNIYIFNGYGEDVPEGRTPIYAGYPQPKAEQQHDEVTKLKGEIGVLVGLLGAAQQVIETIDAENAEESEALIHLHMKITYAIQGASSL